MPVFDHVDFDGHEGVHFFEDTTLNFQAIVAVHSTSLGPSAGGTRFWCYDSSDAAVTDVLRLSRAMSYKNAMTGLDLGGGKAVLLKPKGDFDRAAIFASYGRMIERLNGSYYTAEDVGVSPEDMAVIKTQTDFVAGMADGLAASGDPSPLTADGVFRGLTMAVKHKLGQDDVSGLHVAVQGIGHVGYYLCRHLHQAGAKLWVADVNQEALKKAEAEFGATIVSPEDIHACDVDVFAPCALGGAINAGTIDDIKAKIVAGAANNQLASPDMGAKLLERGILYVPDYVLNAGGIINVASELSGTYSPEWVESKLDGIKVTLSEVFERSEATNEPTNVIADAMARDRIRQGKTPA